MNGRVASVATLCMAGVDFPPEEQRLPKRIAARGWARQPRSRTTRMQCSEPAPSEGWGVGLVCGAGINCVGVAPDGREVRFPALGGDHRRLGRRPRRRPHRRLEGGAKLRRPRPEDDPRARGARVLSGSRRRTRWPRRSTSEASRGAGCWSCRRSSSRRPSTTTSPQRSSSGSPTRSSHRARVALPPRPGDASRSRFCSAAASPGRSEFAGGRADPERAARAVAAHQLRVTSSPPVLGAALARARLARGGPGRPCARPHRAMAAAGVTGG